MDEFDSRLRKQSSALENLLHRSTQRLQHQSTGLQPLVDSVLAPTAASFAFGVTASVPLAADQQNEAFTTPARPFCRATDVDAGGGAPVEAVTASSVASSGASGVGTTAAHPTRYSAADVLFSPATAAFASQSAAARPAAGDAIIGGRFRKVLEQARAVNEDRAVQQQRADELLKMKRLRALASKDLNAYVALAQQSVSAAAAASSSRPGGCAAFPGTVEGRAAGSSFGATPVNSSYRLRVATAGASRSTSATLPAKQKNAAERDLAKSGGHCGTSQKKNATSGSSSSANVGLASAVAALRESQQRIAQMMSV